MRHVSHETRLTFNDAVSKTRMTAAQCSAGDIAGMKVVYQAKVLLSWFTGGKYQQVSMQPLFQCNLSSSKEHSGALSGHFRRVQCMGPDP